MEKSFEISVRIAADATIRCKKLEERIAELEKTSDKPITIKTEIDEGARLNEKLEQANIKQYRFTSNENMEKSLEISLRIAEEAMARSRKLEERIIELEAMNYKAKLLLAAEKEKTERLENQLAEEKRRREEEFEAIKSELVKNRPGRGMDSSGLASGTIPRNF